MSETPAAVLTLIETNARESGSTIIYGELSTGHGFSLHGLTLEDLIVVLRVTKSPLIYIEKDYFDAENDVRISMSTSLEMEYNEFVTFIDYDTDEAIDPEDDVFVTNAFVKEETERAIAKWCGRDGELASVSAYVVFNSVAHKFTIEAEWLSTLYDELDDIARRKTQMDDEEKRSRLARLSTDRTNRTELLRTMAEKLAGDPAYTAPKSSRKKREYLAETLFPDADPQLLAQAVDRADSIIWKQQF